MGKIVLLILSMMLLGLTITTITSNGIVSGQCIGYTMKYLVGNNTILIEYPSNKTLKVEGLTIQLVYDPARIKNLTKPDSADVIRDLGTRLLTYKNTIHILAEINNTPVDLYYDRDTKILVLASTSEEDLALLLEYHYNQYTCRSTTTTYVSNTTTTSRETTTQSKTITTTNKNVEGGGDHTLYLIAIIASILVALLSYILYKHRY